MNHPPSISAALVHSRWGRAALHLLCLVRGGPRRWHLRGIVRELFGARRSRAGRVDRSLCAFLLCALLGGGIPVFAFAGSPALTLLPTAQVNGGGIYLHQLVLTSLSAPIPQTIRLANAPAFGQAALLSREQIGEALKSLAPEFASTNWSGAVQIRVTRRVRPLDESALKNPSLELVEAVPAGQPLLARSVRKRPVVLRGQMVDGLVRDGALNISLKVEALADGLPGRIVRVRNPKTKREFYAKVQDEQVVVVNL